MFIRFRDSQILVYQYKIYNKLRHNIILPIKLKEKYAYFIETFITKFVNM